MDWAYKIAVKSKFEDMILRGMVIAEEVEHLYFYVDEHTTATDGIYELKESLEQEFHFGIYKWESMSHFPPLFPNLIDVQVKFCDSKTNTLIRGADIIANKLYYMAVKNDYSGAENRHFCIKHHP